MTGLCPRIGHAVPVQIVEIDNPRSRVNLGDPIHPDCCVLDHTVDLAGLNPDRAVEKLVDGSILADDPATSPNQSGSRDHHGGIPVILAFPQGTIVSDKLTAH